MARVYADANERQGPAWYDYENMTVDWNVPDRYEIVRRIGGGRYSEVFEGVDSSNEDSCVIKVLKPVAKKKIKREIKILRNLAGGPNVIRLMDIVHDVPSRSNSLVMEYVDNTDWKELYCTLTEMEIKHYLFQLLRALDFVHSRGIIHRDVKPANIMFDRDRRKLRLIDWGLAEFYHPGVELHIRVASRYFKGPELLVGYKHYDYSLDMWSVGCILAAMIFRRENFFRGRDNDDQLLKIVKVLGSAEFEHYLTTFRLYFRAYDEEILRSYPKISWSRFITVDNGQVVSGDAIDLLDKLLRYNHLERLTAAEALAHSFFNAVRLETPSNPAECVSDSGFYST
ncbi:kinase-like protein [Trametes elegans]|nr:kinase-like protein [Trametes elegans]